MHKVLVFLLLLGSCFSNQPPAPVSDTVSTPASSDWASAKSIVSPSYDNGVLVKINKSDAAWKQSLSTEQYYVLREKGTERAFTGHLWNNHEKGVYVCAACHMPLFSSSTKFDSGTGWPSFYQPLTKDCIEEVQDNSYGMRRVEVECARCGGHQGHVFDDGPPPTGLRYCINSVSLDFVKD